MSIVYIIYSKNIDRFYVGSCLNLDERLDQHNNKVFERSFTRRTNDWTVFFKIENLEQNHARLIEAHIKRMKSRRYIQNLKKHPEISQKLIEKYVGSSR